MRYEYIVDTARRYTPQQRVYLVTAFREMLWHLEAGTEETASRAWALAHPDIPAIVFDTGAGR